MPHHGRSSLRRSLRDRTFALIAFPDDVEDPRPCWGWKGALSKKRSGDRPVVWESRGFAEGGPVLVARLICEWFHGPAPSSQHKAGHTCPDGENAACISPHHLQWMTPSENEQHKAKEKRRKEQGCAVETSSADCSV